MDDRKPLGLRVMGMSIHRVRFTVRCPTRMRNSDIATRIFLSTKGFQFCHLAFGLIDVQLSLLVNQRHAGTVVTAVLQTMQTFNQNRIRFAFTDISYNSTHISE